MGDLWNNFELGDRSEATLRLLEQLPLAEHHRIYAYGVCIVAFL